MCKEVVFKGGETWVAIKKDFMRVAIWCWSASYFLSFVSGLRHGKAWSVEGKEDYHRRKAQRQKDRGEGDKMPKSWVAPDIRGAGMK